MIAVASVSISSVNPRYRSRNQPVMKPAKAETRPAAISPLIGSLQPGAQHLKKILTDYAQGHNGARPERVLMLIGPEGDFTPADIDLER